ncbi:hypothetical protein [Synechocystis sp. PCC 7338]|uniref:hypothetical protein n=1 Tax=Synechocystis sp. PCC 7338 TaxID=2732530 RepID=UPI001BB00D10|nr:hypothetical protein [Synechocystis sp. PCC 7338]QUS61792.1 hypothetical protein HTZ78_14730 [Synechocystis sp. PCC 7338]
MAMLPLPNYCQIAPHRPEPLHVRHSQQPITLQSFPGLSVSLPEGGYYLTARINLYEHFNHSQVFNACIDYLAKALEKLGLLNSNLSAKLLLVFPDHTRTAIATHLLLDAIFYFKKTYNHLQFTILFGLGTHPPMTDESVSQYLGEERYRKLIDLGVIIRQQTTIAPVKPQVEIKIQDQLKLDEISDYSFTSLNWNTAQFQQQLHQVIAYSHAVNLSDLDENLLIKKQFEFTDQVNKLNEESQEIITNVFDNLNSSQEYCLCLPEELWQHHLTIVAGDTELHPYERRGGSGGLNKMLVVGLANIQAIRRSHSTKVLLSSAINPSTAENAFVHTLEHLVECFNQSLLTHTPCLARTYPLGFSVVSLQNQHINGFWFGQKDKNRQSLTAIAKESHTVHLPRKIHILVADTDKKKGTDILAGARALQYFCEWDSEENCLLADTPRQRVALLFNPCREQQNHGGIGNQGTKKQLDILQKIVCSKIDLLDEQLQICKDLDDVIGIIKSYRRQVLIAWHHHLQLISEFDDFLIMVKNLVLIIQELSSLSKDQINAREFLQATLANYANDYSEEGKSVQELLDIYLNQQNLMAVIAKIDQLQQYYQLSEGLGEGGQRALRCLKLLHKFEIFLLATDNQTVLNYLTKLDPNLNNYLPLTLRKKLNEHKICLNLLGIWGIDLKVYSPQQCLELAVSYGQYYNHQSQDLRIAFLQEPLIVYH